MTELLAFLGFFAASFFYVGLLGFQTKVVAASQVKLAFPLSLCISSANFFVVANAAHNGYEYFMLSAGLGSACGITLSILAHDWLTKRYKEILS